MDLYEFQAKELFAAHGVPVLPGEVADTAVFLASNLGRGVTGNILYVDAGFQIMAL